LNNELFVNHLTKISQFSPIDKNGIIFFKIQGKGGRKMQVFTSGEFLCTVRLQESARTGESCPTVRVTFARSTDPSQPTMGVDSIGVCEAAGQSAKMGTCPHCPPGARAQIVRLLETHPKGVVEPVCPNTTDFDFSKLP
jgi:hypothetical protein